jgi:alkanesulfonate monooxygenase SsuD/methylene tetrahydromethanopterin reductase-like flavin-dependent oxidoreductase (luciferase family)
MPIRFALFDWLDDTGRAIGKSYEQRLDLVEQADKAGFYCYHAAEHHGTPLSTIPSPNLFLAAATQRTKNIRLGVLSYVLPFYQPLRLMEEIAMMDQLSQGRLEVGLSRGPSPYEMATYGLKMEESRAVFEEALQIVLQGLAEGKVDFHGKHFTYDDVETRLRPVQKPYPPLWYPTSNFDSIPWLASQGFSAIFSLHLASKVEDIWTMLARYREEYAKHRDDLNRINGHVKEPNQGFMIHVHVADTDKQATAQARSSWEHFFSNFSYLWIKNGDLARYEKRSSFDQLLAEGKFLVGSPATVRDQLQRYVKESGANYCIGAFSWGNFSPEQVKTSVGLFASEVMPAFTPTAA